MQGTSAGALSKCFESNLWLEAYWRTEEAVPNVVLAFVSYLPVSHTCLYFMAPLRARLCIHLFVLMSAARCVREGKSKVKLVPKKRGGVSTGVGDDEGKEHGQA